MLRMTYRFIWTVKACRLSQEYKMQQCVWGVGTRWWANTLMRPGLIDSRIIHQPLPGEWVHSSLNCQGASAIHVLHGPTTKRGNPIKYSKNLLSTVEF